MECILNLKLTKAVTLKIFKTMLKNSMYIIIEQIYLNASHSKNIDEALN